MRAEIATVAICLLASPVCARGAAPRAGDSATAADVRQVMAGVNDILTEAQRHLGQGNFTGRPGSWCAWFASAVLKATGRRPLADGLAASALAYGPRTGAPRPGDLAVMPGHVGFVVADLGARVTIVSGNWSHRVALTTLPRAAFVAFVKV